MSITTSSTPRNGTYDVVVLGSGVIGLSITLELAREGFRPVIIARDLPEDVYSTGFASPWAGANWHSFESDPKSQALQWDIKTFERFKELHKERPDLCGKYEFVDVYKERVPKEEIPFHHITGDFREIWGSQESPLPGNFPFGHKFTSYNVDAPRYTQYLAQQVSSLGIPTIRRNLISLDQAYDLPEVGPVDLVVNATGLGSRALVGVEDGKCYPARGQTVLVRAPLAKRTIMRADTFRDHMNVKPGEEAPAMEAPPYIIPRPGGLGHVVLGGTYEKNVWSTQPDYAAAETTLKSCFNLEPALAPNGKSWKDIEVVGINVGIRPCRVGGARVELQRRKMGDGWKQPAPRLRDSDVGREVGVVHAYGFAGVGFIASYGAALDVVRLAKEYRELSGSSSNGSSVRAKL